ncbi:MAG: histidine--tRNA ligase [Candidatus Omnitrophica bacterium]|nr:histidine--tRNA ligase [Candidatus Omnitrophota bacterium]
MFKKVPGTKDILPDEAGHWQAIEEAARNLFSLYNYRQIRTPIIEEASLFNRTLGNTTEIVQKQMFLIHNQNDVYALRPEGTASIARSYLENNMDKTNPFTKLYYIGPMFRLERPQKGRLRQFHHIGCEVIGSQEAILDVEVISLAAELLKSFAITEFKIKINSLGCPNDKQALGLSLKEALHKEKQRLCPDCKVRIENNILRILDCKNEGCQKIVKALAIKNTHLCPDCLNHFKEVEKGLGSLGIAFEVEPFLVRGLDYYNRTVFEFTHSNLGSQDAIGAGGRYNNLIKELGGPDIGGIGFAFGIERLILASMINAEKPLNRLVYLITLGETAKAAGVKILNQLRSSGIPSDMDYLNRSLKAAMRAANDAGARYVLILGEDELKKDAISLKDMSNGTQREINIQELTRELKC